MVFKFFPAFKSASSCILRDTMRFYECCRVQPFFYMFYACLVTCSVCALKALISTMRILSRVSSTWLSANQPGQVIEKCHLDDASFTGPLFTSQFHYEGLVEYSHLLVDMLSERCSTTSQKMQHYSNCHLNATEVVSHARYELTDNVD